jgi:hypothetical protein
VLLALPEGGRARLVFSTRDSNERAGIPAGAAFSLFDLECERAPRLLTTSTIGCLRSAFLCALRHDRGPKILKEILLGTVFEMSPSDRLEIRRTSVYLVGGSQAVNRAVEVSDCFRGSCLDR